MTATKQAIQAMEKKLRLLSVGLSELQKLDEMNRPDLFNQVAINYIKHAEQLSLIMRSMPYAAGVPNSKRLIDKAILDAVPIEMGFTEENWFCIRLPMLLPKKGRGNTEYIRGMLYPAMQEFFRDKDPVRYDNCVLIFRHVYDRNRPERQLRDHDNVELNMVVDTIALYILYDDAPLRCQHHYISAAGNEERTEVYVVPVENFLEWYIKEPLIPDKGVTLYEKRHTATEKQQ